MRCARKRLQCAWGGAPLRFRGGRTTQYLPASLENGLYELVLVDSRLESAANVTFPQRGIVRLIEEHAEHARQWYLSDIEIVTFYGGNVRGRDAGGRVDMASVESLDKRARIVIKNK